MCTKPTLTGHRGRHRPNIHIRSSPAGHQLPNLKSQEVTALYLPYKKNEIEKARGGGLLSPRSVRVNSKILYSVFKKLKMNT